MCVHRTPLFQGDNEINVSYSARPDFGAHPHAGSLSQRSELSPCVKIEVSPCVKIDSLRARWMNGSLRAKQMSGDKPRVKSLRSSYTGLYPHMYSHSGHPTRGCMSMCQVTPVILQGVVSPDTHDTAAILTPPEYVSSLYFTPATLHVHSLPSTPALHATTTSYRPHPHTMIPTSYPPHLWVSGL